MVSSEILNYENIGIRVAFIKDLLMDVVKTIFLIHRIVF